MALPAIYGTLARLGMRFAKGLSSKSIGKAASKVGQTKYGKQASKFASKQFSKLPKKGKKILTQEKVKKVGQGVVNKYDKLYGATLGTSTRRKVTSGTVGGYALGSFLAGDDIE